MPHTGQQAGEKKHRKMVLVAAADKSSSATFLMCKAFRDTSVCLQTGVGQQEEKVGFLRHCTWVHSPQSPLDVLI